MFAAAPEGQTSPYSIGNAPGRSAKPPKLSSEDLDAVLRFVRAIPGFDETGTSRSPHPRAAARKGGREGRREGGGSKGGSGRGGTTGEGLRRTAGGGGRTAGGGGRTMAGGGHGTYENESSADEDERTAGEDDRTTGEAERSAGEADPTAGEVSPDENGGPGDWAAPALARFGVKAGTAAAPTGPTMFTSAALGLATPRGTLSALSPSALGKAPARSHGRAHALLSGVSLNTRATAATRGASSTARPSDGARVQADAGGKGRLAQEAAVSVADAAWVSGGGGGGGGGGGDEGQGGGGGGCRDQSAFDEDAPIVV